MQEARELIALAQEKQRLLSSLTAAGTATISDPSGY
jgi:hypothetical protein